jgi:nitric oxide synthase oxygenase domain/subunit
MSCALICADPHHPLSHSIAGRFGLEPRRSGHSLEANDAPVLLLQCASAAPLGCDPGQRPLLEVAPWHLQLPEPQPGAGRLRHTALLSELSHYNESLALERLLLWPYGAQAMAWLADQDLLAAIEAWLSDPWQGERWLEGPEVFSAEQTASAIDAALQSALSSPAGFAALKFEVCDHNGDRLLDPDELRGTLVHAGVNAGEVNWVLNLLGAPHGIEPHRFSEGLGPALEAALAEQSASVQAVALEPQAAMAELLLQGWREEAATAMRSRTQASGLDAAGGVHRCQGSTTLRDALRTKVIDWIPVEIVPALGVLSRRAGRLDGQKALLLTYRLANGRVAVMERTVDFREVALRWQDAPEGGEEISWVEGDLMRSLTLVDGRLVALRVQGHWLELNRAEKLLISAEPLPRWMVVLFRRSGRFQLEQELPRTPDDPICRCAHISCGRLGALISQQPGASLAQMARQTKATTICGGCIPMIEGWLAAGGAMPPGAETTARLSPLQAAGTGQAVQPVVATSTKLLPIEDRPAEARAFLEQCYREQHLEEVLSHRLSEVEEHLQGEGSYRHTYDELAYGARLAWRNSTRCLGRHLWKDLDVRDRRDLESEEQMFAAIVEHITAATNGGQLRSTITVFRPDGRRIWNPQFCRYAGYRQPDGSVLGDPLQLQLTEALLAMGWDPGERSRFALLPIVIQLPGREPRWFALPEGIILEVAIQHPHYSWFADLGLRWYALPAVSNMAFDCGGIQYTAAPFNGFYMGTEIGACNFSDLDRYNQLPLIAAGLGLDTSSERTLWRDRAVVELNVAVLHSYEQAGVRMADHHTLTQSFMEFSASERQCGRAVQADPRYVVPSISASLTPTYHSDFDGNQLLKPNFFFQPDPWIQAQPLEPTTDAQAASRCPFHQVS